MHSSDSRCLRGWNDWVETPAAVLELIRSQELTDLIESEFQGLVTPGPSPPIQLDPSGLPILSSSFPFLNSTEFVLFILLLLPLL